MHGKVSVQCYYYYVAEDFLYQRRGGAMMTNLRAVHVHGELGARGWGDRGGEKEEGFGRRCPLQEKKKRVESRVDLSRS